MEYTVIGMREEKYVGKEVSGHNCDFEYTDKEMIRHVMLLKKEDEKFELTLEEEQGECGSGWCTASYGKSNLKPVSVFAGKTHICSSFTIDLSSTGDFHTEDFSCDYFTFSEVGGCHYYPSGGYSIVEDMFKPVHNLPLNNRLVHIFLGDSNLGKSYIAALTDKDLFETDSVRSIEDLPDQLGQDIIVIGNRFDVCLGDIEPRLVGNPEVVIVEFSVKGKL